MQRAAPRIHVSALATVRAPIGHMLLAAPVAALLVLFSATHLAAQADLFPGRTYPVGNAPGFIVAARLDADALPDLVVANSSSLSRLLNQGDGTWQVLPEIVLGAGIDDLLAVDLNGDGYDDIVTLHDASGPVPTYVDSLRVHLCDGAGGLALADTEPVGLGPVALATGDLNEDGAPDLVTTNSVDDTVSILFGLGDGTLAPAVAHDVGNIVPEWLVQPRGVAVADLNEDGHLDVVTANYVYPSTLSLLFGDGTGALAPSVNLQIGTVANWAGKEVLVGDMNEDGHVDLVTGGYAAVRLGDGTGAFGTLLPGISSSVGQLVDVNEDGHLDVVSAATLTVALGDGLGAATAYLYTHTGSGASGVVVADLDGDGHVDAAAVNESAQDVAVFFGDGSGAFPQPPFFPIGGTVPRRLAAADLDDDGALDVISMNDASQNLSILRGDGAVGDGAAGFLPATLVSLSTRPLDIELADLNDDGDEDAVVLLYESSSTKSAVVLAGDGAAGLLAETPFALGTNTVELAVGDVDEDGRVDLLTLNTSPTTLSVRLGDGALGFGPPMTSSLTFSSGSPARLYLADMNGDAHLDVVASHGSGGFLLRHGDGNGGFGLQLPYAGLGGDLQLADLDADGDLDIVGEGSNGFVGVMLGALGGYTLPVFPGLFDGVPSVGDIDADGDLDIVVAGWGLGTFACLLGNGAGGFTLHGTFVAGGEPIDTAIEDLDGDGYAELIGLCVHSGSNFPEHVTVLFGQTPSAWLGLGQALAGSQGAPKLVGQGTLAPSSPLTLTIEDGKPFGMAALVIGGAAINAPFKSGTLVPLPSVVLFGLPLDSNGRFQGSGSWYGGLPPGTATYFQAWMLDVAGPVGWSATNGLLGVTP